MKALIIGGTRGIGKATAEQLRGTGWEVGASGKQHWDVRVDFCRALPTCYDAVDCAGSLAEEWAPAFAFPMMFYRACLDAIVSVGGVIVAVSSVAAARPAKVNAHYAAAKAALESYARTVADSDLAKVHGWRVEVVRFELVETDMLKQLPAETLTGRTAISAEEAAKQIVDKMKG